MGAVISYRNVFAPKLLLEVDGKLATDLSQDLVKFDFIEGNKQMMEAHFLFHDKGQKYVADNRLHQHGVLMRVRWGYPGEMSEVFTTIITRAKPTFPQQGMPTVEAIAFDPRVVMNKISSAKNWGKVSSSEVARRIAKEYGYGVDVEDSGDETRQAKVQSASTSDIQFLLTLADRLNFACYLDEKNVLHFHKHRLTEEPNLEFWYFSDNLSSILTFAPKMKMEKTKPKKVGADGKTGKIVPEGKALDAQGNVHDKDKMYDPNNLFILNLPTGTTIIPASKLRQMQENVAAQERAKGVWPGSTKGAPASTAAGGSKPTCKPLPATCKASTVTDKKAAAKYAAAATQKVDMSAVEATATVIGTPRLRAHKRIYLRGLGALYSGAWYVTKVRHTIQPTGNVYLCELELSRADPGAKKKGKTVDPCAPTTDPCAPEGARPDATVGKTVLNLGSGTAITGNTVKSMWRPNG